jgi:hypothetical protein
VDENVPPPYLLLIAALDQMLAVGTLSQQRRIDAERLCCSGVQGFTEPAISGPLQGRERAVLDKLATQVVDTVIDGLGLWRRDDRQRTRACPPPDPALTRAPSRPSHPEQPPAALSASATLLVEVRDVTRDLDGWTGACETCLLVRPCASATLGRPPLGPVSWW